MSPEKLVYQANQIAKFFASQPEAKSVANILDHLQKYWDPRMRREIIAHAKTNGADFNPRVLSAVRRLTVPN